MSDGVCIRDWTGLGVTLLVGLTTDGLDFWGIIGGWDGMDWLDTQSAHWIASDYIAALLIT